MTLNRWRGGWVWDVCLEKVLWKCHKMHIANPNYFCACKWTVINCLGSSWTEDSNSAVLRGKKQVQHLIVWQGWSCPLYVLSRNCVDCKWWFNVHTAFRRGSAKFLLYFCILSSPFYEAMCIKIIFKVLFNESKVKTLQNYTSPDKLEVNWISLFFLFLQIQSPAP